MINQSLLLYILPNQSLVPQDKSYIFFSFDCNNYKLELIYLISKLY